MQPFLKSIAEAYSNRYGDLSNFCFLFPSKRSATFFLKYYRATLAKDAVSMAPITMTISDLATTFSGVDVDNRIDLLLRLFKIYNTLQKKSNKDEDSSFDAFLAWGETVLSDFSEVDLYAVDPNALFKNIADLKSISADYLSDKQRAVLQDYFGYDPGNSNANNFWRHFPEEKIGNHKLRNKFLQLWEALSPLYHTLNSELEKDSLTTPGGLYRLADERLKKEGENLLFAKKIVAVGFNALTSREISIFEQLSGFTYSSSLGTEPYIDFIWDATGPVLNPKDGFASDAAKFIAANRKLFPEPEWITPYLKKSNTPEMPKKIKVISSPGNVQQAKLAGKIVADFANSEPSHPREIKDAKVAVVLPDEQLLFPMLGAVPTIPNPDANLPKEHPNLGINLTMGYPLKISNIISFSKKIRMMQLHRSAEMFFKDDIKKLLAHPFCITLLGLNATEALLSFLNRYPHSRIQYQQLIQLAPKGELIFSPLGADCTAFDVINYLDSVTHSVEEKLRRLPSDKRDSQSNLDAENIAVYRDGLRRLKDTLLQHTDVKISPAAVFRLSERLSNAERVTFEGEPLQGLQIMGLLETRALDFKHIVITSLNEKVMPRKVAKKSFIPQALRSAFNMPPAGYEESIFSYYFYRLISRAETITLIYDSRVASGLNAGGVSRYVQQLIYQLAPRFMRQPGRFTREDYSFSMPDKSSTNLNIKKSPEVMAMLEEFKKPGSNKKLSATSIMDFSQCQARFFYKHVLKINDDIQSEGIDNITMGNIVHDVMCKLYFPDEKQQRRFLPIPIRHTKESLTQLKNNDALIGRLVTEAININYYKIKDKKDFIELSDALAIVAELIIKDIKGLIELDIKNAPITFWGGEISKEGRLKFNDTEVNFRFAIDRIDSIKNDTEWRIVDYKTGYAKPLIKDFEQMFSGEVNSKHALQLLIYAFAATSLLPHLPLTMAESKYYPFHLTVHSTKKHKHNPTFDFAEDVKAPCIYDKKTSITLDEKVVEAFIPILNRTVEEIFAPGEFAANTEACKYCYLKQLCQQGSK